MRKKTISCFHALALTTVFLASLAVNAAGDAKIRLTADKNTVTRGEQLTYSVTLSDCNPLRGVQLGLDYDASALEIVDCKFTELADNAYASKIDAQDGSVHMSVTYEEPFDMNGVAAQFAFKVKESAKAGDIALSVTDGIALAVTGDGEEIPLPAETETAAVLPDHSVSINAAADNAMLHNNDEVKYMVSVSELSDVRGISAALRYDSAVLSFVSAEAVGVLADNAYTDAVIKTDVSGEICLAAAFAEPTILSGDVVELTFKVDAVGAAGEFSPLELRSFEASGNNGENLELGIDWCADEIIISHSSIIEMSCKSDKKEVKPGSNVTYTLNLDRIAMSRGFQTKLLYNPNILTFVDCKEGNLLTDEGYAYGINTDSAGVVGVSCTYDSEKQVTGEIAELTFRVNEGAADGYIDIGIGDTYAVDSAYEYIDIGLNSNIVPVYIGRLARAYELRLSSDKEEYLPGDTVYLTADLGELSEFRGIQFKVAFDPEKLEYIVPERNSDYYGSVMSNAGTKSINTKKLSEGNLEILVGYGTKEPYSGDGKICTAAFKVISAVTSDTTLEVVECTPSSGDSCSVVPATISIFNNFNAVIEKIESIGAVTLESRDAIKAARAAYEGLTDAEKARVTNYGQLVSAEEAYYKLLSVYDYSYTVDDDAVTVSVKNNKSETDSPILIAAQYDVNGVLVQVDFETVSIQKGSIVEYKYKKAEESSTIKLMLWNDLTYMKPYNNK